MERLKIDYEFNIIQEQIHIRGDDVFLGEEKISKLKRKKIYDSSLNVLEERLSFNYEYETYYICKGIATIFPDPRMTLRDLIIHRASVMIGPGESGEQILQKYKVVKENNSHYGFKYRMRDLLCLEEGEINIERCEDCERLVKREGDTFIIKVYDNEIL